MGFGQIPWRVTIKRVGWWPLVVVTGATAVLFLLSYTFWPDNAFLPPVRVIETILPLVAALQAAFLFSAEDEESLELLLTVPRPLYQILLARLLVLLAGYVAAGLLLSLLPVWMVGEESLGVVVGRWWAPLFWFVGSALFLAQLSRQGTFAALATLLLWAGLLLAAPMLVAGCRVLLPIHAYLQPDQLGSSGQMYLYNRVALVVLGGMLLGFAVRLTQNEERLLGVTAVFKWRHLVWPKVADWGWLAAAMVCLYFSQGLQVNGWAAWLAPLFLWQFVRRQPADPGLAIAWAGVSLAIFAVSRGATLFTLSCTAFLALQQAVFYILPFVGARYLVKIC